MRLYIIMGIACTLMLSGCVSTPQPAHAQSLKIGVIDIQRIITESGPAKAARDAFLKDREAKQAVLMQKRQEVLQLQERMKQDTKLSEEDRKYQAERINQERKDLSRLASDLEEELKKKDVEMTRAVLEDVSGVVNRFRQERGYALVLERKAVVSFDDAIDITDEIIRRYNNM
jgi:outer membrane protein